MPQKTVLAADLMDCVERCSTFVGAGDRGLVHVGLNDYLPNHLHQLPKLISEYMTVDVAATTVSPMDKSGYFTFGAANDFTLHGRPMCRISDGSKSTKHAAHPRGLLATYFGSGRGGGKPCTASGSAPGPLQ